MLCHFCIFHVKCLSNTVNVIKRQMEIKPRIALYHESMSLLIQRIDGNNAKLALFFKISTDFVRFRFSNVILQTDLHVFLEMECFPFFNV